MARRFLFSRATNRGEAAVSLSDDGIELAPSSQQQQQQQQSPPEFNNDNDNRELSTTATVAVPVPGQVQRVPHDEEETLEADVREAAPHDTVDGNNTDNVNSMTMINRAFLPEVVDATGVAIVMSDKEEEQLLERRRRFVLGLGSLLCLIVAAAIIVPLVMLSSSSSSSTPTGEAVVIVLTTPPPTDPPTMAPTAMPTAVVVSERLRQLLDLLQHYDMELHNNHNNHNNSASNALQEDWWNDRSSAPYKAAAWLADEDDYETTPYDYWMEHDDTTPKLRQRFALATFYFATSMYDANDPTNNPLVSLDSNSNSNDSREWTLCGPTSVGCPGNRWLSSTDECTWHYVSCQNVTTLQPQQPQSQQSNVSSTSSNTFRHVTELNFPPRGNNLRGFLPAQLSLLTHLQVFSVANNELQGGLLPFTRNSTTPSTSVTTTTLENDNDNNNNKITVVHAIDRSFAQISTLQVLILHNNDFYDHIPTQIWTHNPQLRLAVLNENRFVSTIPTEMAALTQLVELQIATNLLTGAIPTWLGLLNSSLKTLELASNRLTGSIPNELYDLTALTSLTLSNNIHVTGPLDNRRVTQWSQLRQFQGGDTRLSGTLPESMFGTMTGMEIFKVQHAAFEGSLSEEIARWNQSLQILWLQDNQQFRGELPQALDVLTNLEELRLTNTSFRGTISQAVCDQRGDRFRQLSVLTVDCQEVNCTCCDDYDC